MSKKSMFPDVYVCSKPLQYFNIKNIPYMEGESKYKILVFLKAFIGAEEFINNIKLYDDYWDEVVVFEDLKKLRQYQCSHPANFMFVENDASLYMAYVKIINKIKRLYVFEEGIGSYENSNHNLWNKIIRKILGIGTHYGDAVFCENIILYNSVFYNKKWKTNKAISFRMPFRECLEYNYDFFLRLSGGFPESLNISDKSILIYITDHIVNMEIVRKMIDEKDAFDLLFIKPHPHIKDIKIDMEDVMIIESNLMFEFIIHKLLKNKNRITIWHEASTSVVYFLNDIETQNWGKYAVFDEFVNNLSLMNIDLKC